MMQSLRAVTWVALGLSCIVLLGTSLPAHSLTIDFETDGLGNPLAAGTLIGDEYAALGVTFSTPNPNGLMIFDASNPTGGDTDLGFPSEGNILIISEDGDASDPDDNAGGGIIDILFNDPVSLERFAFADLEKNQPVHVSAFADAAMTMTVAEVFGFDTVGGVDGSLGDPNVDGNNELADLVFNAPGVRAVRVEFAGSGSLAAVSTAPVPEPRAAVLFAVGLAIANLQLRAVRS